MTRLAKSMVVAALVVVAGLVVLLNEWRWFEQAIFSLKEQRYFERYAGRSLWLSDYQVVIDAQKVEGISSDLSALTFDPDRQSLFSVTNQNPELLEISLEGELLRRIRLIGFADPEAVEYVGKGEYVISDERLQLLVKVKVDDKTQVLDAAQGQQLSLGIDLNGNKGFEGLAYDARNQRLFVGKERDPIRIYEVRGFPIRPGIAPYSVHVHTYPERDEKLFIRDLSSLDYHGQTDHLLVLSDESQLLLELNTHGKPISALSLKKGEHGLKASIPQAEGIASDQAGNIYVVSEPNLFYKFSKTVTP